MSEEAIVVSDNKKKAKRPSTGSTQPISVEFSKWLEYQFRGGETPQYIDAYPLEKKGGGRHRQMRLSTYSVRKDETIGADRAVEISNEILSGCQLDCDGIASASELTREGTKRYEIACIDDRRGGQAYPVGTFILTLSPRIHRPAPTDEDSELSPDDGDALLTKKLMIGIVDGVANRSLQQQQGVLHTVGDTMMLMKGALDDAFRSNRDLVGEIRNLLAEFRQMAGHIAERRVEERAIQIDAENAVVDREYRRAQMAKENVWTDVTRAGLLEGVRVLGALVPGFGQLAMAMIQGHSPPPPPQIPGTAAPASALPADGQAAASGTQLATIADERKLVDSFVLAAESNKIGDRTAAEKLFGRDDDDGKQLEAGVFTREQVNILAGVRAGKLPVEALDALLSDSGKPEAVQSDQLMRAMAFMTPSMVTDIGKFLTIRNEARAKKGATSGQ